MKTQMLATAIRPLLLSAIIAVLGTNLSAQTPCGNTFQRLAKDSLYRVPCDSIAVISAETYRRILSDEKAKYGALLSVVHKRTDAASRLASTYEATLQAERQRNAILNAETDTCRARYDDLFRRYESTLATVSEEIGKSERTAREVRTQVINLQFQVSEYEKALPKERRKAFVYGAGAGALIAILVGSLVVISIR